MLFDLKASTPYFALALLAIIVGLYACYPSIRKNADRHAALYQATVQYATMKVLANKPEWADDVVDIAAAAADSITDTGSLDVHALEAVVRDSIDWTSLGEERALVNALIISVRAELESAVSELPEYEPALYAKTVLEWIADAARMMSP